MYIMLAKLYLLDRQMSQLVFLRRRKQEILFLWNVVRYRFHLLEQPKMIMLELWVYVGTNVRDFRHQKASDYKTEFLS